MFDDETDHETDHGSASDFSQHLAEIRPVITRRRRANVSNNRKTHVSTKSRSASKIRQRFQNRTVHTHGNAEFDEPIVSQQYRPTPNRYGTQAERNPMLDMPIMSNPAIDEMITSASAFDPRLAGVRSETVGDLVDYFSKLQEAIRRLENSNIMRFVSGVAASGDLKMSDLVKDYDLVFEIPSFDPILAIATAMSPEEHKRLDTRLARRGIVERSFDDTGSDEQGEIKMERQSEQQIKEEQQPGARIKIERSDDGFPEDPGLGSMDVEGDDGDDGDGGFGGGFDSAPLPKPPPFDPYASLSSAIQTAALSIGRGLSLRLGNLKNMTLYEAGQRDLFPNILQAYRKRKESEAVTQLLRHTNTMNMITLKPKFRETIAVVIREIGATYPALSRTQLSQYLTDEIVRIDLGRLVGAQMSLIRVINNTRKHQYVSTYDRIVADAKNVLHRFKDVYVEGGVGGIIRSRLPHTQSHSSYTITEGGQNNHYSSVVIEGEQNGSGIFSPQNNTSRMVGGGDMGFKYQNGFQENSDTTSRWTSPASFSNIPIHIRTGLSSHSIQHHYRW